MAGNPLRGRSDLVKAAKTLLTALETHYVEDGGGYALGATGARFSPRVSLIEGFSRSLWALAPLLAGGERWEGTDKAVERLKRGIDPADNAFWGFPQDADQRLVEMAAIALCLLIAPEHFWLPLASSDKQNLFAWLSTIERLHLPANNWHCFRLLVCAAFRSLGLETNEKAERYSINMVESMYRGDGWYQDGVDENFDYYNPSGFHFYGLLLARIDSLKPLDLNPPGSAHFIAAAERRRTAELYRERVRLFTGQFLPWFHNDGSVIPYGRSLCYRFGAAAFLGAIAFANEELIPWSSLKGFYLRNLRWWFSKPILNDNDTLSIGYAYPNLIMAEQYNSPSSPYWGLKAFLPLALPSDHPFWRAEEAPPPEQPKRVHAPVPNYIISRSIEDAVLLCPGRYPGKELIQGASKFSKFAYSARFAFCVSHGSYGLEQTGCDSMLVLSEGDGYWRERRRTSNQESGAFWTYGLWRPWDDVLIQTLLVAAGAWHLRFHLIQSMRRLFSAEGGFAIPRFNKFDSEIDIKLTHAETAKDAEDFTISLPWAASRIVDLKLENSILQKLGLINENEASLRADPNRTAEALYVEPNLNLIEPVVVLPLLRSELPIGVNILACAVHAGDTRPQSAGAAPTLCWDGSALLCRIDNEDLELPLARLFGRKK